MNKLILNTIVVAIVISSGHCSSILKVQQLRTENYYTMISGMNSLQGYTVSHAIFLSTCMYSYYS